MSHRENNWTPKTMPVLAPSVTSSSQSGLTLRLWEPDLASAPMEPVVTTDKHRIPYPVPRKTRRKPDADGQRQIWDSSPLDPAVAVAARRSLEQFRDPKLSPEQVAWLRENLTLRNFYSDWMEPDRLRAVSEGRMSPETLSKDRQVISRWEQLTRPDNWKPDIPWPGMPLGSTTGQYVQHFLGIMKKRGYADGTILTTKTHLVTILHRAEKLGLVDSMDIAAPRVQRTENRSYSDQEASAAYRALAGRPSLQCAFVLSLATGARPRDLFGLRFADLRLDRSPVVRFHASKTGVYLVLPISPIVVAHLDRLPRESAYLFPGLSSPDSVYPERSTAARRRNSLVKSLLLAAGVFDRDGDEAVAVDHPWQVGRATAATWIERVARGMSSVLLGHASDDGPRRVTQVHYLPSEMEPSRQLVDAVHSVEWPQEILKGVTTT